MFFLLPILFFLLLIIGYLVSQKAIKEAYWSLFVFNAKFYSQRYDLGQKSLFGFLIKIINDYLNHFYQLIKSSLPVIVVYFQSH